jgi:hypothetical protein
MPFLDPRIIGDDNYYNILPIMLDYLLLLLLDYIIRSTKFSLAFLLCFIVYLRPAVTTVDENCLPILVTNSPKNQEFPDQD